jgi:hypothetical protein
MRSDTQSMRDPLVDPRAADLLAAIPHDVGALAADFRTAAGESEATAGGLSAARLDGAWTGRAAAAFRRAIGRLPAELGRLGVGFAAVGEALSAYESELAAIRPAFRRVLAELADVELGAARPGAPVAGDSIELENLRRRAFELLEEFSRAREACRYAIGAARASAPVRPSTGRGITVVDATANVG